MRENVKHWLDLSFPIVIFADEKEAEPTKNVPEARRFTHLRSLSSYQAARRSANESARLGILTDLYWCLSEWTNRESTNSDISSLVGSHFSKYLLYYVKWFIGHS